MIDYETYIKLLNQVSPFIEKDDMYGNPLVYTSTFYLFLATGRAYSDLKYTAIISNLRSVKSSQKYVKSELQSEVLDVSIFFQRFIICAPQIVYFLQMSLFAV